MLNGPICMILPSTKCREATEMYKFDKKTI